jgi:hypothetical protein
MHLNSAAFRAIAVLMSAIFWLIVVILIVAAIFRTFSN